MFDRASRYTPSFGGGKQQAEPVHNVGSSEKFPGTAKKIPNRAGDRDRSLSL